MLVPQLARIAIAIALATLVAGCQVGFHFRATGAEVIEDLAAEDQYSAVYARHLEQVHAGLQLFAPTDSSPGVCNAGGSKQGCYDADAVVIGHLQAMLEALESFEVPPRFHMADVVLKEAIGLNIRGLQLRNDAIAQNDDGLFQEHKLLLQQAVERYEAAYELFPEDNRPVPAP